MSKMTKPNNKKLNKLEDERIVCCCRKCGEELTEDNCRGYEMLYCISCESKVFSDLERVNGTCLAFYLACARFDLPLYPLLITNDKGELIEEIATAEDKWLAYIDLLYEKGKLFLGDRTANFQDGETYLLRIFGREMSEKTFGTFVINERKLIASKEGTEEQRLTWGERDLYQNVPMTTSIYNELDRRYESRMARLKGITIDEQLVDTQRKLCKMLLAQDHLLSLGDVAAFDKLQKSIDSIQAAEQLRKKDEKPIEGFKFDSSIKALEDAGLVEDGKFLNFDATRKALLGIARGTKYNYPIDMVDQMLFGISNNMRANAGVLMETELPEDLVFEDSNGEFLQNHTAEYEEKAKFIGSTNVRPQISKKATKKK